MRARALLVTALLVAANCTPTSDVVHPDNFGRTPPTMGCPSSRATQVSGHIGPDVSVRALCGLQTVTTVPLATVDVEGDGSTSWSVSLAGNRAFGLPTTHFLTCQTSSPTLATTELAPSFTASPGAVFDAIATVSSDDGSFPTGQVSVHLETVAPQFTITPAAIDFGDVLPDQEVSAVVVATSEFTEAVVRPTSTLTIGAFHYRMTSTRDGRTDAQVTFSWHDPGDYTDTWSWTAMPAPDGGAPIDACTTTKAVSLHARVISPDASASDGGADTPDGGADSFDSAPQ
jgi:hypothetical protein